MNRCERCGDSGPDEWLHHTVDTDGEHWWCPQCCPDERGDSVKQTIEVELTDEEKVTKAFEAIGAASTCWDNLRAAGVFESDRAKEIAEELCRDLGLTDPAPEPEPRTEYPPGTWGAAFFNDPPEDWVLALPPAQRIAMENTLRNREALDDWSFHAEPSPERTECWLYGTDPVDEVLVAAHSLRPGDRIEWAPGDWREITKVRPYSNVIMAIHTAEGALLYLARPILVAVRR